MAIAGRLAKGALDALGGKKYTGKKTTGQRAKDITNVAVTGGTQGRRTGKAVRNRQAENLRAFA